MQTIRFPFYFRTQEEFLRAKDIADALARLLSLTLPQRYGYRFKQCTLSNCHPSRRRVSYPAKVPGPKKWIAAITLSAAGHRAIGSPDINARLRGVGLEPIEKQTEPTTVFQSTISAPVVITSKDKLRKLASALDKKIGPGNWRIRGYHGYKKQLAQLTKTSRVWVPKAGKEQSAANISVPVHISVSSTVDISLSELEKIIFTVNLKS